MQPLIKAIERKIWCDNADCDYNDIDATYDRGKCIRRDLVIRVNEKTMNPVCCSETMS